MAGPTVSYAQRFEDLYLMRCFAAGSDGFYIDIGSGHPVYDNTSFAFYLKGWHGITVEPNPWLARLSRAVRPRDRHIEALVGATVGEAVFYLVNDFHGFSTMIESHARAAQTQFGKSSQAIVVPVTTLSHPTRWHPPGRRGSRFSQNTATVTFGSTVSTGITSPRRRANLRTVSRTPRPPSTTMLFSSAASSRRLWMRRIPITGWRACWRAAP